MKKMKRWEKGLEMAGMLFIVISIIGKAVSATLDTGILVMLSFMAIMLHVIFFVAAFFPATWRMTSRQLTKIVDREAYQEIYRKSFLIVNFIISIGLGLLIMLII